MDWRVMEDEIGAGGGPAGGTGVGLVVEATLSEKVSRFMGLPSVLDWPTLCKQSGACIRSPWRRAVGYDDFETGFSDIRNMFLAALITRLFLRGSLRALGYTLPTFFLICGFLSRY